MIRSDANQERSQSRTKLLGGPSCASKASSISLGPTCFTSEARCLNKEFFSSDIGATWLKHLDKARGEGVTNFNQKVGLGSGGILKECMADTILATAPRKRAIAAYVFVGLVFLLDAAFASRLAWSASSSIIRTGAGGRRSCAIMSASFSRFPACFITVTTIVGRAFRSKVVVLPLVERGLHSAHFSLALSYCDALAWPRDR